MADDNLECFEYRYNLIEEEVDAPEHSIANLQNEMNKQEWEIGVLKKIHNFHRFNFSL